MMIADDVLTTPPPHCVTSWRQHPASRTTFYRSMLYAQRGIATASLSVRLSVPDIEVYFSSGIV